MVHGIGRSLLLLISNHMNEDTSANESLAVVVRDTLPVPQPATSLFGTTEPLAIIKAASTVASALKDVIKQQGLISNIKGKEYPRCEAWTLLGTMLGIFPVLVWSRKVDDGWEARVEAKMKDGTIVGAAEAECLRSEHNWQNRDDFALRSMAQTRATAKALRMPLGFVMTLSGFEATPAEEMTFETSAPKPTPTHTQPLPTNPEPKPEPKIATKATRDWMIEKLKAGPTEPRRQIVTEYFRKLDAQAPWEELEELPLHFVPVTLEELKALSNCIDNFESGGDLVRAFDPHYEGEVKKPIETKAEPTPATTPATTQAWFDAIVPIPHRGQKRDEYMRNPDTIGSLYLARHGEDDASNEARQRLWGFCEHFEPKGWTKRDGTEMPPSESDIIFRKYLDEFKKWFSVNHPDEKL